MRHFLILLALFGVVAVNTPYFWIVWDMSFGAARVGIVHDDGVMQWSESGPKAHWLEWIPDPEGAELTTQSYYEAAPGYPESGLAMVALNGPVAAIQAGFAKQLMAAGWDVTLWNQSTVNSDLPPRDIRLCSVTASQGKKSLVFTLIEGDERSSKLTWQRGAETQVELIGSTRGRC
ncbi:MAG: hypothetical protein AAF941_01315 [Pseudomonadota bacterium]